MKSSKKPNSSRPTAVPLPSRAGETPFWGQTAFRVAVLVLMPLLVYLPSYRAGFIWDDDLYATQHLVVTGGWDGLAGIWLGKEVLAWFPITFSSFWLEWRLWGMNPTGYHVTNVLLHSFGAVLVWRVLCKLKVPAAWFAALLYAIHPVCVASVAWIAERKNTLSMVFFALSLLFYLRFDDSPPRRRSSGAQSGIQWYSLSLLAFVAALLSKPAVVALPLLLLLFAWWRRGRITWRDFWRSLPFFGAALAVGLITIRFENYSSAPETAPEALLIRLLAGSRALWFYVGKTLLPLNLAMIYPRWQIDPGAAATYVPALLCGVAPLIFWHYRKRWSRAWLFAFGCLVLALAPVLGIFNMNYFSYSQRSDQFQYLAVPGIMAFLAAGATWLLLEASKNSAYVWLRSRWLIGSLACAVVGLFAIWTWQRQQAFASSEALWRDNLPKNPNSWKVRYNLGVALVDQRKLTEAIRHYEQALLLKPDYADAHNNLGGALRELGRYDEAIAHFETAMKLSPFHKDAPSNLGVVLMELGRHEEAMPHLLAALKLNPRDASGYYNLGNLLGRQGKRPEAITYYRAALKLAPSDPEIHNNLACLLLMERNFDEATEHFSAAIRLKPDNVEACNNLGSALLEQNRAAEAVAPLTRALQLKPAYAEAHYNLANAYAALNKGPQAFEEFQAVLRLNPSHAPTHYKLGNLFATGGNIPAAVEHYRAALAANPDHAEAHYQLATILVARKEVEEGIKHYREAVRLKPDWLEALNNLAWLLATHPEAKHRNGQEAVRWASHAVEMTKSKDPEALDTLAAACAEAGQFSEAVGVVQAAIQLAASNNSQFLARQMEARLKLYQGGRPYRE
jgi:protein O-mannosyl-transferase